MKKITAIVLVIMLLFTSLGGVNSVFAATVESRLPNTYAKMLKGEEIRVGYFGGSVTNGYGVDTSKGYTQDKDSWRGKSLKWLNDTYSAKYNCKFTEEFHAGLGGTGSDFNLYRADRTLWLSDKNKQVDLLFIEFSINDSYKGGSPYDKSAYYMESIIRKVRTKNPTCDIVVVLTTDHTKLSAADRHHMNGQAHVDVAEHYGIPYIWLGDYMYDFLKQTYGSLPNLNSSQWNKYYMDSCHPNQEGYTKYFEFLRDNILKPNLERNDSFSTTVVNHTLPAANYNTTSKFLSQLKYYSGATTSQYYKMALRTDAYDIFPSEISTITNGYGFYKVYNDYSAPFSAPAVKTSTPCAKFSATFNSKSAGMYFIGNITNGAIMYRVDNGAWKTCDMYRASQNTHEHIMFYENLPEKKHTVDVILKKTVKGGDFTFKGFFVDGDSAKKGVTFGKVNDHDYEMYKVTKATPTANGKKYYRCKYCYDSYTTTIYKASKVKLSTTEYTYNGKAKKPSVKVYDSKGNKISSKYYTVKYESGRKKVGKYKVTVTFKTDYKYYSGKTFVYFKINPGKTSIKKLTAAKKSLKVSIKKKTTQVTGYQIRYSVSKKFSSYKSKTLSSNKKISYTIKDLYPKVTYYVKVRTYKTVNGKKYYSGWSTYKYKKTK